MKKNRSIRILSIISLIIQSLLVNSQITINAKTTPEAGDVLKMISGNVDGLIIESAGPDRLWDFSSLRGGVLIDTRYTRSTPDMKDVDMIANSGEEISYLKKDEFGLNEVICHGEDPVFGIRSVQMNYKSYRLVRPYHIKYNNFYNFEYAYELKISHIDIPQEIKDFIPFINDSIKLMVNVNTSLKVDAWGKLMLQKGNYYEVLRMKEINVYNTKLYIRTDGEWNIVSIDDESKLFRRMNEFKRIKYHFINDFSKESIAIVDVDSNNKSLSIIYKDVDSALILPDGKSGKKELYIYPNPSFGAINIVFLNVNTGNYKLTISNILGKELWSNNYSLNKSGIFKEDLSYLSKGPYLYSITGPKGNRLVTRKISILKP